MNALLAAIMTKTTGSALSTAVGGRIYLDEAPHGAAFPYVVFRIVASRPEDTFTEAVEDTLLQFSLFSESAGATEITGIYANLTALFDRCALAITGSRHIEIRRQGLSTMVDDITTPSGTASLKHWAVDYAIAFQTP